MALVRSRFRRKSSAALRRCHRRVNSDPWRLTLGVLRMPELGAFGAHGVRELELGAIADVGLDLLPVAGFLNFLARGADRENARQGLHIGESLLQFGDHLIFPGFFLFALADVAAIDDHSADGGMIQQIVRHNFKRDPRAVGVLGPILDGTSRARILPEFASRVFDRGAVFGMKQFEPRGADYFFLLVPQYAVNRRADVADAAVGVANGKDVMAVFDHLTELIVRMVSRL